MLRAAIIITTGPFVTLARSLKLFALFYYHPEFLCDGMPMRKQSGFSNMTLLCSKHLANANPNKDIRLKLSTCRGALNMIMWGKFVTHFKAKHVPKTHSHHCTEQYVKWESLAPVWSWPTFRHFRTGDGELKYSAPHCAIFAPPPRLVKSVNGAAFF